MWELPFSADFIFLLQKLCIFFYFQPILAHFTPILSCFIFFFSWSVLFLFFIYHISACSAPIHSFGVVLKKVSLFFEWFGKWKPTFHSFWSAVVLLISTPLESEVFTLLHLESTNCDFLPHTTCHFCLIDFELNTDFPSKLCVLSAKSPSAIQKSICFRK